MFDSAYTYECLVDVFIKDINLCKNGIIRYIYLVDSLEYYSLFLSIHGGY